MIIGNTKFDVEQHTYVMGILNVTPDSFSDGGRFQNVDKALSRVETMISEGASVIDIGGESTRPGYTLISEEEEIARVVPVIEAVKSRFDVPVSLDTYKSKVAKAGIESGVDLINDIWGLKYDPDMSKVIAEAHIACCLMHNRRDTNYTNFLDDIKNDLSESLEIAYSAGIKKDKIILDPGVGFAKSYENNLEVINRVEVLKEFGCPVLLATSRKSVIGLALDLPFDERVEGTVVTTVLAALKGCGFVRVHDVKENVRAIKMIKAIMGG